jgi:hypothetical protein
MIKTSLKLTAVATLLAGASVEANAETDLGTVPFTTPQRFPAYPHHGSYHR